MKTRTRFILPLFMLAGFTFIAGCFGDEGEGCFRDWDCKRPLVCVNGSCESAYYECWGDADCPQGKYCDVDGFCHTTLCYLDAHCEVGSYCDEHGSCQPYACLDDWDCESDHQICDPIDGTCVELGYACWDDWDCPAGEICIDGTCNPYCWSDWDCPNGSYCNLAGECIVAGCWDDYDCFADEYCDIPTGLCVTVSGCLDDYDCAFWYPDMVSYCGIDGLCYDYGCTSDIECLPGEVCGIDGLCYAGECFLDVDCQLLYGNGTYCDPADYSCYYWDVECYDYWDCYSGEICLDGLCLLGCFNDYDCAQNEFCDPNTNQCALWDVGCFTDYDCAAGELCGVDGACYYYDGCLSDLECGVWETCDIVTGLCTSMDLTECYFDSDCQAFGMGNYCDLDRKCVECLTDYDCPKPTYCDFATGWCI